MSTNYTLEEAGQLKELLQGSKTTTLYNVQALILQVLQC